MSNALSEEKKQQVIALGKLGWPLRRIEQATGVRRETASAYLKAAGLVVRPPRYWGKRIPAKPAIEVTPDHGFTGSYQAVKRFVRKLRGPQPPEPTGIILTAPGEEAQVDYGSGPMVRDPHSGKYRRTRLFVLTLGYSRKSVRLLAWRSSARTWAELHEKAFRRLGGCT